MEDPEKGALGKEKYDPVHEAPAAKLWAVYVSEAEKYDRGLVESWRSDMEGMLIFAGLFSASLTAFLIESYKTLVPNSGDTTAFLLAQISQQIAASSNGTSFVVTSPAPFSVPTSSLICNVLWFLSLGLSLTCALVATLLEQWARDFLHRADMRSAPVIRARVFSFLYYGLRRFQMHTVVEIIPLMLHASLFLFFVGLVAFLVPVNAAITAVAGIILGTVTAVYTLLTLLPLFHLDCPYRTPLSGGLWRLLQNLRALREKWHQSSLRQLPGRQTKTMVEGIFRKAVEPSDERFTRDKLALIWTVKSLTDESELEPFIEAIADVITGPPSTRNGWPPTTPVRTDAYDDYMRALMIDRHVQLLRRLDAFHGTCTSGLLTLEARTRREIAACKAVWALGSLSTLGQPPCRTVINRLGGIAPEVQPYLWSAVTMQNWANLTAAGDLMAEILVHLHEWMSSIKANGTANRSSILKCMIKDLHQGYGIRISVPNGSIAAIEQTILQIHEWPALNLLEYLFIAAKLSAKPYRFETTLLLITPSTKFRLSAPLQRDIEPFLQQIVENYSGVADKDLHWVDKVFRLIASYWDPDDAHETFGQTCLPLAVVKYINIPRSRSAVDQLGRALTENAWRCLPRTIDRYNGPTLPEHSSDSLTAVWTLFWSWEADPGLFPGLSRSTLEEILHSISQARTSIAKPSALVVVKRRLLLALRPTHRMLPPALIARFKHPLLPQQTSAQVPDLAEGLEQISRNLDYTCDEGLLCTLIEFIECCCSTILPYKAVETLQCVARTFLPQQIHPIHQLRL
ncbi:hypothetical protein DFH06DRAFT_1045974, partial [Mycena polygramma]